MDTGFYVPPYTNLAPSVDIFNRGGIVYCNNNNVTCNYVCTDCIFNASNPDGVGLPLQEDKLDAFRKLATGAGYIITRDEAIPRFRIPHILDLAAAVNYFNAGRDHWCTGNADCQDAHGEIGCDDCIMCCNTGNIDPSYKCFRFATYAEAKGFNITRAGIKRFKLVNPLDGVVLV